MTLFEIPWTLDEESWQHLSTMASAKNSDEVAVPRHHPLANRAFHDHDPQM
jgi:hypothetical protein